MANYDVNTITDDNKEIVYLIAKRRNPKCIELLKSEEFIENLMEIDKLEREGISFYSGIFVLGIKKIE